MSKTGQMRQSGGGRSGNVLSWLIDFRAVAVFFMDRSE